MKPGRLVHLEKLSDELQVLAFTDYGSGSLRQTSPGEDRHVDLASAGCGLRYTIGSWLSVRFDYGWQLIDTGLDKRFNSRAHVGVVISY
jgi:hemolysin activation/secretion protein